MFWVSTIIYTNSPFLPQILTRLKVFHILKNYGSINFRHFKFIGLYTHRETTVFSSMNILIEAILDLAVPTNDSLLDPRGKKA